MVRVLEVCPDPKAIVPQARLTTAARRNVHRAVHQLVPIFPEEEKELPSGEQQPSEVSHVPHQPWTRTRTRAQQLSLSCLLICTDVGLVEPMLESKIVEIGDV